MTEFENLKAVHNLLITNSPENFIKDLTEMWEAWIRSEFTDGSNAKYRAEMLMSYKNLCEFLSSINAMEMFHNSISDKNLMDDLIIAKNKETIEQLKEKIEQHHE